MVLLPGCGCCESQAPSVCVCADFAPYSVQYDGFDSWDFKCGLPSPLPWQNDLTEEVTPASSAICGAVGFLAEYNRREGFTNMPIPPDVPGQGERQNITRTIGLGRTRDPSTLSNDFGQSYSPGGPFLNTQIYLGVHDNENVTYRRPWPNFPFYRDVQGFRSFSLDIECISVVSAPRAWRVRAGRFCESVNPDGSSGGRARRWIDWSVFHSQVMEGGIITDHKCVQGDSLVCCDTEQVRRRFHLPTPLTFTTSPSGITASFSGGSTFVPWIQGDMPPAIADPSNTFYREHTVTVVANTACFRNCDYSTNLCCNPLP